MPHRKFHYPHEEMTVTVSTVEKFAAAYAIYFGSWLMLFGEMRASTQDAFAHLIERTSHIEIGSLTPIQVLGSMCMASGVFYLAAIIVNGRGLSWTPFVRMLGSVGGFVFFTFLVEGLMKSATVYSTGVATYSAVALVYFILFYVNLSRVWEAIRYLRGRMTWMH